MDPITLIALANLAASAVASGIASWRQMRDALQTSQTDMTDAELNQIEQWVMDDAARRKAQRDIDAGNWQPPAA